MLRINQTIIGLLAVVTLAATAWAQDDYQNLTREPNNSSWLDIKVWLDKGDNSTYEPGEDIRVFFKTSRDAYVMLYNIDTKGNVHLLFPYDYQDSRYVEGNRPYRIPGLREDYYLRVNGPEGTERIVAIASRDPFYIPDLGWDIDPNNLSDEDYYFMHKPEGEDDWDFIERLNDRVIPDFVDYELDVATFSVESRYPRNYYTQPSFYFGYHHYPTWYSPSTYFGSVYFDYPYGAAIYIDGIFFGYSPLYLPYFLYGRHYLTVYHYGYIVYRDYCYVRPHYRNSIHIPQDRIYKYYTSRYAKDYRVIKNKPEIFWTKVRELNTKYKPTPVIKDDFTGKQIYKETVQNSSKYKESVNSERKISKEKQYRDKFRPTGGDQIVKIENKATPEKFRESVISEPKISKEKQLKQKTEFSKGDRAVKTESSEKNTFKQSVGESPEKRLKEQKEVQIKDQDRYQYEESREQTYRKQVEKTQSDSPKSYQESKRDKQKSEPVQIEKSKPAEKVRDSGSNSSRQESGFKNSTRSVPQSSGKADRSAPKGKK